jgi:hypothetical protein
VKALEGAAQGGSSAQTMVNGGSWQQAATTLRAASGKKERKKRGKEKGLAGQGVGLREIKWDVRKIFNGLGRALDWAEWVGKQ